MLIAILSFLPFIGAFNKIILRINDLDQNVTLNVCDETSEYSVNDPIKLSDWNGELNGGNYHVILLEMSASW